MFKAEHVKHRIASGSFGCLWFGSCELRENGVNLVHATFLAEYIGFTTPTHIAFTIKEADHERGTRVDWSQRHRTTCSRKIPRNGPQNILGSG